MYGISHGGNRGQEEKNSSCFKSQSQLASDMGMDVRTLQNYKLLAEMIPELEELLDIGIVTKTTVLAVMKNLSVKEQEELVSSLDTTKRITQSQMEKYINGIKVGNPNYEKNSQLKTQSDLATKLKVRKIRIRRSQNFELDKVSKSKIDTFLLR